MDEAALEVDCPVCEAAAGDHCDAPVTHLERQDAAGDPGPFSAFDLDGDGERAWQDLDDPGHWF